MADQSAILQCSPQRCEECGEDFSMKDLCPRAGSGPLPCPWRTASNSTTAPPADGEQTGDGHA
ncbi:hypothetical protein Sme01_03630 [Sphaerisporangium melleum]|uniref:Uncharacterized protein n=1 Tax=Sphaerisporangium melleum TaxID=321316 RepID=A0A917QPM1_9ACTN|nr:hypothetical protein GCM10007964_01180 [Sphaerisporangium melleum]GII67887.1 hypothetical protein Sme01_03630 [Sphaerisporangium melleum]